MLTLNIHLLNIRQYNSLLWYCRKIFRGVQFWLHVVKLPCGSVGCLHSLPTQDVPDCATCSSRQGCGDLFVEPVVHLTIEMLIFSPSPNFWSLVLLGQYLLHMSIVGCCKRLMVPLDTMTLSSLNFQEVRTYVAEEWKRGNYADPVNDVKAAGTHGDLVTSILV